MIPPSSRQCGFRPCSILLGFLAALLLAGQSVWARAGEASHTQSPLLNFKVFSTSDGLPSAQVRRIFQDSRGFLWLATTNGGLLRYEGKRFTLFRHDPAKADSISGNTIWDIVEDSSGDLYFATTGGLSRWSRKLERFEEIPLYHPPGRQAAAKDTRRLQFDQQGRLWIGTHNLGIQILNPGSATPLSQPALTHLSAQSLCFDSVGHLWIGTWSDGLYHYDPETQGLSAYTTRADQDHLLPDNSVRDLVEDRQGRIWVATVGGLCRINHSTGKVDFSLSEKRAMEVLGSATIDDLMVASDGRLWLGTDGGGLILYVPEGESFVAYHHSDFNPRSLASNCVRSIYEDRDGDLWTGHYPTGLSHASRLDAAFTLVRHDASSAETLSGNIVYCFAEGEDGRIWIGTDREGLNVWDRKQDSWTQYRSDPDDPETLSVNTIASLYVDRNQQVWASTWNGGLNRLDPKTGRVHRYPYNPENPGGIGYRHVKEVMEDQSGRLWVATDGGGINRYLPESDQFASYKHVQADARSLNSDVVLCFAKLRDGTLLAGTLLGVARYVPAEDAWHPLVIMADPSHPLNHLSINDIIESSTGELWLSTADAGLFCINAANTLCRRYGTDTGLPSDSLRAVEEDSGGAIWGTSINGLFRLDPKSGQCWTYHIDNGIQGPLFNRHARLKTRSGELFFGGTEGFNIVSPALVTDSESSPNIVLTRLEVFNQLVRPDEPGSPLSQSISESTELVLPNTLNIFSLEFSSLRFQDSRRGRFQYKLEGLDEAWRLAGAEQRAVYTNLNPGNYLFRVREQAADGSWDPRGAQLGITVVPAFYQTNWFKGLAGFLLLAVSFTIARVVLHRRLRASLREVEQERLLALERQKTAEQRAELEQQLAQVQRMDSIGRLAGGVAHDLNNMIQPILGFSELALLDLPSDSPVKESILEITRAAERSRDLVRQLLAFARKQTLEMRTLDFNAVLSGFYAMLRRTLREDINVELKLGDTLPALLGDAGQLEQIILNLAVNAQDAMPKGGSLFLETSLTALSEGFIGGEEDFLPGNYLLFSCSDTGCGIPKEALPRVFEPFYSTKGLGKGTGLGLATVYGIVRQHNGHIRLYSEEGQGTTIRIYFPVTEALLQTPAKEARAPVASGTETLLVVEDESQVRLLTCTALTRAGFRVIQAGNSSEALRLAQAHEGVIHLLLTDIILPDFNGRELYERLHELRPELRVLFMSGYSADVISHHGVLHEDLHFIQKPFNISLLLDKVRNTLDAVSPCGA